MNAQQTYCVSLVLLSPCLGVLTSSLPNPIPWDQGHLMILRKQKQEEEDFWRLPTPRRHSCPSASAQAHSPFPPLVCPICAPDKANPPPAHQVSPLLLTLGHQVPLPPTSSISPLYWITYTRGQQMFFVKSQPVNILGPVNHMICVTTTQLYCLGEKQLYTVQKQNKHGCVPIKNVFTKMDFEWD